MEKQLEKMREFLEAKKQEEEQKAGYHRLDLQFFAGGKEDDGDDPEDDDDPEDGEDPENDDDDPEDGSTPSLEQLLKENPDLKKQFDEMFKERFKKRLKGVDLKLAKKLIKEHSQKQQGKKADNDDGRDNLGDEIAEKARKIELKAKRLAVKEYAVDHNLNPKLLARLVDFDRIELNEDGEVDPDDLEEVIEELTEEFPELFRSSKDEDSGEDEGDDQETKTKTRSHKVVSRKKTNKPKEKDLRELGKNKALERAKRKGLIKD